MTTTSDEPKADVLSVLMNAMEATLRERGFAPTQEIVAQIEAVLPQVLRDNAPTQEIPSEWIDDRISGAISLAIAAAEKRLTRRVEIVHPSGETVTLAEQVHKQFESAVKFVSARNAAGYPVPCWFYGAAGGGKSHLFRQLAKALGFTDYSIRGLGPTDTISTLVGYVSQVTGQFMPGLITPKLYGEGGLVALDEVCNADPSCLTGLNDLTAGVDFRFANGLVVPRSKRFVLIASDNTKGNGSTGGFIRNKQDISALSRYVFFRLDYDEVLEETLCGNAKWAKYVQSVRAFFGGHANVPVYITPRASINGAALLAAGIPASDVMESVLFAHCSSDQKTAAIKSVGEFRS